jgi:hypothetical protein
MRSLGWGVAAVLVGCGGTPFTTSDAGADASTGSSGSATASGASAGGSGSAMTGTTSGMSSAGTQSGSSAASGMSGSNGGCPTGETPCAGQCCLPTASCHTDPATGDKTCAKICTDSTQCTGEAPATCCGPDVQAMNKRTDTWVCQASSAGGCRCTDRAQCTTNACAPLTDSAGNPVGPYICKPNGGQSYDGCGTAACNACIQAGYACYEPGGHSTYFCGKGCAVDKDCGDLGVVCCTPMTACGSCPVVGVPCSAGVCVPCGS